jgi:hypothetical protein
MLVKCPDSFAGHTGMWKVFLAGPIQGAPKWQFELPEIENVMWISPRRDDGAVLNDETHRQQMEWETQALRTANIILFWIPEEVEHVEGRGYAQTTRFELGENLGRGKRIIMGVHDNFPGRLYFEYKAYKYPVIHNTVYHTLEECVEALKSYIATDKENNRVWYTSNLDFDLPFKEATNEEKLKYDKKWWDPFYLTEHEDWKKIEYWNSKVAPCDTIYHVGNFGDRWALDYLSGNVKIINSIPLDEHRI